MEVKHVIMALANSLPKPVETMSDLAVRKLLIDLDTPFDLRWNGGDAFTSALIECLCRSAFQWESNSFIGSASPRR
jgi:hypothetical protein